MALDIIYVLLLVAWGGLGLGFWMKDYTITSLSSIFMIIWGLYTVMNGIVGYQNWFTEAFSIINMMTGCYVFLRSSYELYKNW